MGRLGFLASLCTLAVIAAPAAAAADGELMWTRGGTGHSIGLAIGDIDGDGKGEPVVAGRGVGVLKPPSLDDGRYAWFNDWDDAPERKGDSLSAEELALADLDGDGLKDIIAGTDQALFAISGASGATLWTARDSVEDGSTLVGAHHLAVGDFNADGTPDVAFDELFDDGVTAVDGRTGAQLWHIPRPYGYTNDLATGDLDLDGAADVVVAGGSDIVGTKIVAISGRTGAVLWSQEFPPVMAPPITAGAPGSIVIADVAAGGVVPEVVVAGTGAIVMFEGRSGAPLAAADLPNDRTAIALRAVDLVPGGRPELAAAVSASGKSAEIAAYDSALKPLWSAPLDLPALDIAVGGPGSDVALVAGGGTARFGGTKENDGFVVALGADGSERWRRDVPEAVPAIATGSVFGVDTVLAGQNASFGDGGGVIAFGASGQRTWKFRTGGRVEEVAAADLDGDGTDEVLEAADDSAVSVHDATGSMLWTRRIPGIGSPDAYSIAAGELGGAEGLEIVAGTFEYHRPGPPGRMHAYDAQGDPLWSRDVAGLVDALAVTDLDADGEGDIAMAAASPSFESDNGVVGRYSRDGEVVWEKIVALGVTTSLSLVDANDDGTLDLVTTKNAVFSGGTVYVHDGRNGDELWRVVMDGSTRWASVSGDVIAAGDNRGVRVLSAADGAERWKVLNGGVTMDGAWSIDANGDGTRDVVVASSEARTLMLSGTDGAELWSAPHPDEMSFTVDTLESEKRPLVIAGGHGGGVYGPSTIAVLDARTGGAVVEHPVGGPVLSLAPGAIDDDLTPDMLAGSGWKVLAVRGTPVPRPTPTPRHADRDADDRSYDHADADADHRSYDHADADCDSDDHPDRHPDRHGDGRPDGDPHAVAADAYHLNSRPRSAHTRSRQAASHANPLADRAERPAARELAARQRAHHHPARRAPRRCLPGPEAPRPCRGPHAPSARQQQVLPLRLQGQGTPERPRHGVPQRDAVARPGAPDAPRLINSRSRAGSCRCIRRAR